MVKSLVPLALSVSHLVSRLFYRRSSKVAYAPERTRGKGSDTEYYGEDVFGGARYASLTDYDYIAGRTRYRNIYDKQYGELTA